MDSLIQDVRYAMRGLRRAPAFTIVALLTLALGIGVNASIFSVVNAILFRPLPVELPSALVDVYGHTATASTHDTHSYPNYLDYRANTKTLSGLIAYSNFFANLSIRGSSEIVIGELVTDNYFQTLGVRPVIGRAFVPDEFRAQGAAPRGHVSPHERIGTYFCRAQHRRAHQPRRRPRNPRCRFGAGRGSGTRAHRRLRQPREPHPRARGWPPTRSGHSSRTWRRAR